MASDTPPSHDVKKAKQNRSSLIMTHKREKSLLILIICSNEVSGIEKILQCSGTVLGGVIDLIFTREFPKKNFLEPCKAPL